MSEESEVSKDKSATKDAKADEQEAYDIAHPDEAGDGPSGEVKQQIADYEASLTGPTPEEADQTTQQQVDAEHARQQAAKAPSTSSK